MFDADILAALNLSQSESALLSFLYETGEAKASEIARAIPIKRQNVYAVLLALKEKGLVTFDSARGVTKYVANPPKALLHALEKKKEALERAERSTLQLVEYLETRGRQAPFYVPKLRWFDGKANVNAMLYDMLPEWELSMIADDRTLWGFQDHSFVEHYRKWLRHHWLRNKAKSLSVKLFSNEVDLEKALQGKVVGREVRSFPSKSYFKSTMWICGDYIILISINREQHYAIQLKDQQLAHNIKAFVQLLWRKGV